VVLGEGGGGGGGGVGGWLGGTVCLGGGGGVLSERRYPLNSRPTWGADLLGSSAPQHSAFLPGPLIKPTPMGGETM